MKNMDNMQQKKVADEELNQVNGGIALFDIFTADFRGKAEKPVTLEMIRDPENDKNDFELTTLEMRDNPLKKEKDKKKVVKL